MGALLTSLAPLLADNVIDHMDDLGALELAREKARTLSSQAHTCCLLEMWISFPQSARGMCCAM